MLNSLIVFLLAIYSCLCSLQYQGSESLVFALECPTTVLAEGFDTTVEVNETGKISYCGCIIGVTYTTETCPGAVDGILLATREKLGRSQ